jgi:hypothetical protein
VKINAGYNALLAKQQGRRCSQRDRERKLKDFEELDQSGKIRECCS